MGRLRGRHGVLFLLVVLGAGCASDGPVVPQPPMVEVTQLDPILITPQVIKFQAKITIENRMRAALGINRVDYAVDLHGRELFTSTFDGITSMEGGERQIVTFPFQVAMKDITEQAVDVLTNEGIVVTFRGFVNPGEPLDESPIPFAVTRNIPFPTMPEVTIQGVEGSQLGGMFTVLVRIKNPNQFPLVIDDVESSVHINQKKYRLIEPTNTVTVEGGAARTIALSMKNVTGKSLSLVLTALQSSAPQFGVDGSMRCRTPYGELSAPIDFRTEPPAGFVERDVREP